MSSSGRTPRTLIRDLTRGGSNRPYNPRTTPSAGMKTPTTSSSSSSSSALNSSISSINSKIQARQNAHKTTFGSARKKAADNTPRTMIRAFVKTNKQSLSDAFGGQQRSQKKKNTPRTMIRLVSATNEPSKRPFEPDNFDEDNENGDENQSRSAKKRRLDNDSKEQVLRQAGSSNTETPLRSFTLGTPNSIRSMTMNNTSIINTSGALNDTSLGNISMVQKLPPTGKKYKKKEKKQRFTADNRPLPHLGVSTVTNLLKEFSHLTTSASSVDAATDAIYAFLEQLSGDLEAYTQHRGAKAISRTDMELLFKRQQNRLGDDKKTMQDLIHEHLPLDLVETVLPIAYVNNEVVPKMNEKPRVRRGIRSVQGLSRVRGNIDQTEEQEN